MKNWTTSDIPDQTGRLAIVTGAGGLGYETALALAVAGADVILAGRSEAKGREALAKIRAVHPEARIAFEVLDLASLASIADFVRRFGEAHQSLDLLVNNAGVMNPPKRKTTADGFELQFGTNHLGHFALTAGLLPQLRLGRTPRVVSVSSLAHRSGRIDLDDLQAARRYRAWTGYTQSKLANLLFAFELQRRSDALGWGLMSTAAHPGFARTELIPNGPGSDSFMARFSSFLLPFASQSAAEGALPSLLAATSPEAKPSSYYGPNGFYEMKGPPAPAYISARARDTVMAKKLWVVSEELTGARWPAAAEAVSA